MSVAVAMNFSLLNFLHFAEEKLPVEPQAECDLVYLDYKGGRIVATA